MTAKQAKNLKPGEKLHLKMGGREVTVKQVLSEPTDEHRAGRFPLILTEEEGPITYLLLKASNPW